ncbi:alpha/beta hydrolase [Synechococcus sp. CBW1006]|uniref:alpha/beta hydrolase n=1 Tax=Synechococcus sp. CBW1006 TaxID=1353138 RepID=UPI001E3BF4B2|nr:hypothetical protein [Synechococcus sp. CBW1006]
MPSEVSVHCHSDICYAPSLKASHGDKVTLDVFKLASTPAKGAVIFLHGGGLRRGSKKHVLGKDLYFNSLGYNFVSCNYPLSAECTACLIDDQLLALRSLDKWVGTELRTLSQVEPSSPVIFLGHSAGAYLLALAVSKGLFCNPRTSFILVDSAAYDLSKRYGAARPNVRLEIERLVGYEDGNKGSLDELISAYSPVSNLLQCPAGGPGPDMGWVYLATTRKRFSLDSSTVLASLLKSKLNMHASVKAYPLSHVDISREIAYPDSEIGRDIAHLLGNM